MINHAWDGFSLAVDWPTAELHELANHNSWAIRTLRTKNDTEITVDTSSKNPTHLAKSRSASATHPYIIMCVAHVMCLSLWLGFDVQTPYRQKSLSFGVFNLMQWSAWKYQQYRTNVMHSQSAAQRLQLVWFGGLRKKFWHPACIVTVKSNEHKWGTCLLDFPLEQCEAWARPPNGGSHGPFSLLLLPSSFLSDPNHGATSLPSVQFWRSRMSAAPTMNSGPCFRLRSSKSRRTGESRQSFDAMFMWEKNEWFAVFLALFAVLHILLPLPAAATGCVASSWPHGLTRRTPPDIRQGRKVAVVGANGCGKSTLLSYLSGQATPREGSVRRSMEKEGSVGRNYIVRSRQGM